MEEKIIQLQLQLLTANEEIDHLKELLDVKTANCVALYGIIKEFKDIISEYGF